MTAVASANGSCDDHDMTSAGVLRKKVTSWPDTTTCSCLAHTSRRTVAGRHGVRNRGVMVPPDVYAPPAATGTVKVVSPVTVIVQVPLTPVAPATVAMVTTSPERSPWPPATVTVAGLVLVTPATGSGPA